MQPNAGTFEAVRLLGIASLEDLDSLRIASGIRDTMAVDTVVADSFDRPDRAGFHAKRIRWIGSSCSVSTCSGPAPINLSRTLAGPVDEGYRLGPGDVLVLVLTGEVELAHTLEVNREGFIVIPQVGQLYVANLTLGELDRFSIAAGPGVFRRPAWRQGHDDVHG